jgi:prevent-host-death family protein
MPFHRREVTAATSESLRTVRDRFSEFVDRAEHHNERIVITRNGVPVAVLVNPRYLEALGETLAVLRDPMTRADLIEAERVHRNGDVVRGQEAVWSLRST